MKKHLSEQFQQAKDMPALRTMVTEFFSQYGTVTNSHIFIDKHIAGYSASCLVDMKDTAEMLRAALDSGAASFGYNAVLFTVDLPRDFYVP